MLRELRVSRREHDVALGMGVVISEKRSTQTWKRCSNSRRDSEPLYISWLAIPVHKKVSLRVFLSYSVECVFTYIFLNWPFPTPAVGGKRTQAVGALTAGF